MKFLGSVFSTVIGIFVFILLAIFLIVGLGVAFGSNSAEEVKEASVLELNLSEISFDYAGKYEDPLVSLVSDEETIGLNDALNAIETAKKDDKIKGISIYNNFSSLGLAQYKTLRNALDNFKKSGKFIYAYADFYTQNEYYLNSVADKIFLNPAGEMEFKGLAAELLFYKDLQEKAGVKLEVIRHGKYKSAVEPFLENQMSDANREQITALLNSVWETTVSDIAVSRKISIEKLNQIATSLLARTPQMALQQKLIDVIAYEDVYHKEIKKLLKTAANEDYNKISLLSYTKNYVTTSIDFTAENKIAVIFAQGEINSGEGDVHSIGEGSMRRSLKEARENKEIKAVVLRIDSPGGDALTSELIWREIEITKKLKPVVVSMGNYAASGGYFIACNAATIFAEKNTITGSIGVFGLLPNVTGLANKIGVNAQQVTTHANAAEYSSFLPVSEGYKTLAQEGVERVYKSFVTHVAQGRKMTYAQVDNIAQGRVWTGAEALKIGLVDRIGGMKEALAEAAKLAKITSYATINLPEYDKSFKDVLQESSSPFSASKSSWIKEEIGTENYQVIAQIKKAQSRKGLQMLLPFYIKIK